MILLNDEIISKENASINIEDRGYQFGDGVYEVIRIYDGCFFELEGHFERLVRSAKEIHIDLPFDQATFTKKVNELVERNNVSNGHLYMQVSRGVAPRNHPFPSKAEPVVVAYTKEYESNETPPPGKAMFTEDIRWLRCDIKSLNLLGNVLAKEESKKQGFDEAIFHRGEIVTEGSSTNVFMVKDSVLYTHPANQFILDGITRRAILRAAEDSGITTVEKAFSKSQLLESDEVFISSTTQEVRPIIEVSGNQIGSGTMGDVTALLQKEFKKRLPKADS
ncbi:D-amino-acid transaminase [Alkalihalobacillus sp. CinArs1]|uniref:D-amino-acid transaminase n=1 Tax=Alkalihalobacillus sp. CinArs1 TaxID=2995314 RepID=UPI002FD84BAB